MKEEEKIEEDDLSDGGSSFYSNDSETQARLKYLDDVTLERDDQLSKRALREGKIKQIKKFTLDKLDLQKAIKECSKSQVIVRRERDQKVPTAREMKRLHQLAMATRG